MQLPKGTHDWSRFLTPEELALILQRASLSVSLYKSVDLVNFVYNVLYFGLNKVSYEFIDLNMIG